MSVVWEREYAKV